MSQSQMTHQQKIYYNELKEYIAVGPIGIVIGYLESKDPITRSEIKCHLCGKNDNIFIYHKTRRKTHALCQNCKDPELGEYFCPLCRVYLVK